MSNETAIIAALAKTPLQLAELGASLSMEPAALLPLIRSMAASGDVRLVKIDPPGRRTGEPKSDRALLMWALPGQDIPAFPEPPKPAPAVLHGFVPKRAEAHTKDKPQPIEILARMEGRSSFRTPKTIGNATNVVPVTPQDIAHAIGAVCIDTEMRQGNPLGAAMAMAMACQRPAEWPKVQSLGHRPLMKHLHAQKQYPGIVAAPNTYRARIVLYDAFCDLIAPAKRRNLTEAAKEARMRRDMYRWLLKQTSAFLESEANTAAADAVRYLFALAVVEHPLHDKVRAVSITATGEIRIWTDASAEEVNEEDPTTHALDIGQLCLDVIERPRSRGVLTLNR